MKETLFSLICHMEFTSIYRYITKNLKMAKKDQSSEQGTFIYVFFF